MNYLNFIFFILFCGSFMMNFGLIFAWNDILKNLKIKVEVLTWKN